MKKLFALLWLFAGCKAAKQASTAYVPDDKALYEAIVKQDSLYFNAYNSCDLALQSEMYADNIEFYHDKGGLTTSKEELLASLKKYICGKVTRELIPGSIEVYPIKDFGAIEMGLHRFHNNTEKENTPSHAGKFVITWQLKDGKWKMTRVISLH